MPAVDIRNSTRRQNATGVLFPQGIQYIYIAVKNPGGIFDSNDSDSPTDTVSSANILPSPLRIHSKIIENEMNRWFLNASPGHGAKPAHKDEQPVR